MSKPEKEKIDSSLAGGFRDYLPGEMIPRQKMLETIRGVFERFGFVPLETPGLEKEKVLTGGDENFKSQIFRTDKRIGWDSFALRFDLTVPLARVIALYPNEIKKPFKRYQRGYVWRGEKPQAGRFNEFMQFDVDIIGSVNMMADAEIIAIMYETMVALGIKNFLIRVNSRKILNGLPESAGFSAEKASAVLRAIDKLDRQGWESVRQELLSKKVEEEGVGLSESSVLKIKEFLDVRKVAKTDVLNAVEALMENSVFLDIKTEEDVMEMSEQEKKELGLNTPCLHA